MKEKNELPVLSEDQDIFAIFDQLDDRIVLAELENRITDVWVYHFVVSGKEVWGISKEGVDQCVEKMAKKGMALRDFEIDYRVDPTNPEYVLFTAKVERILCDKEGREVRVDSAIGTKRQRIMIVLKKTGSLAENQFWFEQGSQKALRNARLRLIPVDIKTQIITFAKEKKKIRKVEVKIEEEKKGQKSARKGKADSQEEKQSEFPPGTEKTEKETPKDLLTQEEKMKIIRYEATLVDKYHYSPDQIIGELEKRFGFSNVNTITSIEAQKAIYFLESTMDWAERKLKAEGKA